MVIEDHNEDDVVPPLTTISEESTQSNENLIEQPRNEGAKKNDVNTQENLPYFIIWYSYYWLFPMVHLNWNAYFQS